MRPVLIIAGPTASGKSAFAADVAAAFDGVVINTDSMQLYRPLRILTARPDDATLARAPHRLYGVLEAEEIASAASWREMALREIEAAASKLPIVVGGTGLYLRALMRGLSDLPPVPKEIRAQAMARYAELGPEAFHAELAKRDPATATRLPPGDTQRMVRAWEVFEATGRRFSDWIANPVIPPPDGLAFHPVVLLPPRAALYATIDRRMATMPKTGAIEEARGLADLDPMLPIAKAVGARELLAYVKGLMSLNESLALAQRETRRYAKRQMTWFRNQMPDATRFEQFYNPEQPEFFSFIRQTLLTV
jgi:tRNA dimethylallyltransferase